VTALNTESSRVSNFICHKLLNIVVPLATKNSHRRAKSSADRFKIAMIEVRQKTKATDW
jgi:hypothetical protein